MLDYDNSLVSISLDVALQIYNIMHLLFVGTWNCQQPI